MAPPTSEGKQTVNREQMIEGFVTATMKALGLLTYADLPSHALVVLYSSIDTVGLLDAPPEQVSASGASFKNWVKTYMLGDPAIEFNEVDLWGARCAVLHTFTAESDLSRAGQARQLQYFGGDENSPEMQAFIKFTKAHENGAHLPVHVAQLHKAFGDGLTKFAPVLARNCQQDAAYEARLRKVLQTFRAAPPTQST